ncbi:MAG: sulfatase [Deltaproteobacteria bacterium]|nr:sulfatase [Deltaproteobacteria bacterium]
MRTAARVNARRAIGAGLTIVLGLVGAGTATNGCRSGAPPRPNLVLVNVDTLRADHLGCYGYGRDTSPFIDRLAREGVRVADARTNSSFTREAVAALFTGKLPSTSGAIGWAAKPAPGDETLAQILERAGYATGFFSATTVLTDPGFARGFGVVRHLTEAWGASGLGPKLSEEALGFVARAPDRPFFLYLHYLDPHGPYAPSPARYRKFAATPVADPLNIYSDVRPRLNELRAAGFGPGDPRFEDQVARYDAEIADTDDAIAALFAGLQRLGVLDRTLVVLTSDHGEEFLDHGFVEHAWTLYDEVLRVPLVLWPASAWPASAAERRAATVDLLPTILDALGIRDRPPGLDGASLAAASAARPFVAELLIAERNTLRALIDGRWKYVAAQRWLDPAARPAAARAENELRGSGAPPLDPCGAIVHEELYDLGADPRERQDRVRDAADVAVRLRAALAPSLAACRRSVRGVDRPTGAGLDEEDRRKLRALGYVE